MAISNNRLAFMWHVSLYNSLHFFALVVKLIGLVEHFSLTFPDDYLFPLSPSYPLIDQTNELSDIEL